LKTKGFFKAELSCLLVHFGPDTIFINRFCRYTAIFFEFFGLWYSQAVQTLESRQIPAVHSFSTFDDENRDLGIPALKNEGKTLWSEPA